MIKYAALLISFSSLLMPGKAQNNAPAPATTPIIVNAGDVYNPFIEKQSRLYNGIEHIGYSVKIKSHAYFLQRELSVGSVLYDELPFENVLIQYDLLKDQVVVQHYNGFSRVGLVSNKVKEFTLLNHHFIRLQADSSRSGGLLFTGFYDVLYEGKLKVLARRWKFIEETIKDELERTFIQQDQFYIEKDGVYYTVRNYKGLLTVLKDKAPAIKQYLRKNRIKYRKGPETAIVKATAYYDSLNK